MSGVLKSDLKVKAHGMRPEIVKSPGRNLGIAIKQAKTKVGRSRRSQPYHRGSGYAGILRADREFKGLREETHKSVDMAGQLPKTFQKSVARRVVPFASMIVVGVLLAIGISACFRGSPELSLRFWSVSFSPDSASVVTGGGEEQGTPPPPGELVFWRIANGHKRAIREPASIRSVVWSPNGKFVAVGDFSGVTKVVSAETGKTLLAFSPPDNQVNAVAVSPDGNLVAGATLDGTIDCWNVTGKEQHLFVVPGEKFLDLAISPNGLEMVATSRSGNVLLFNLVTQGEPSKLQAYPGPARADRTAECAAFSHNSLSFATGSLTTLRIWETHTAQVKQEVECAANVNNVAFSPDDGIVATVHADGTLAVWNCNNGQELNSTQAHPNEAFGLSFSPDGKRIATVSRNDRTIKIWDAKTLKLVASLQRPKPK
jgi:WD40 repeat protein